MKDLASKELEAQIKSVRKMRKGDWPVAVVMTVLFFLNLADHNWSAAAAVLLASVYFWLMLSWKQDALRGVILLKGISDYLKHRIEKEEEVCS